MTEPITTVEAIAEELAVAGVDRVFGLPGGEVLFLIDALRRRGIEFVLCRHESAAGIAAAVYGKLRRVPGVVLTTLGPGAANLMLPLANSLLDREPLVAISASLAAGLPPTHTHQRLPLLEVYRPVTKYCAELSPFAPRRTVRRALSMALEEPAGPAFLTLSPKDGQAPAYDRTSSPADDLPMTGERGPGRPALPGIGDPDKVAAELTRSLGRALKPLVLLGLGVRPERATALRSWLDAWGLPVAVTPKVKGLVDETGDRFVGVVGGMAVDGLMMDALTQADLLIGFGLDPVELDKAWHAGLPITWVLESPSAGGRLPAEHLLAADHGELLERLIATRPPARWDDPFRSVRRRRREVHCGGGPGPIPPTAIVRRLADVLPPETIVTTDVGAHKYLFGQFWPSRQPETFFVSNGLSGMGYGLPAAIGAQLARPASPVLAVVGDGGLAMTAQELETAARVGAPVVVLVMADHTLSLIRMAQEARRLPLYGVEFSPVDAVSLARAWGFAGTRVSTPDELAVTVSQALAARRGLVVEVPVAAEAYRPLA